MVGFPSPGVRRQPESEAERLRRTVSEPWRGSTRGGVVLVFAHWELTMTSKKAVLLLFTLPTLFCWLPNPAWGQEARASLGGKVTDPQGAVIPSASVVVISDDTGVKQKATTNPQGNRLVQFLIPGHYSFTVTVPGFEQAELHDITLLTADHKQADVKLEIGAATQQIQVTAEAPLIDTTSATSGTVVSPQEIREMPTSSRLPTLFATFSPGVMQQDLNSNVLNLYSYTGLWSAKNNSALRISTIRATGSDVR
jgi:hypothetical protein